MKLSRQLRYLQTLNGISAENNSTIIFPVPIDIMSSFMQSNQLGPDLSQPANLLCQHLGPPTTAPAFQSTSQLLIDTKVDITIDIQSDKLA